MAHAYDRTLLSSLGFADKDKGNGLHDFACLYVADESDFLGIETGFSWKDDQKIKMDRGRLEVPITKGHGQYKTTIGFADVVRHGVLDRHQELVTIGIEVKVGAIGFGEVLRQIQLAPPIDQGPSALSFRSERDAFSLRGRFHRAVHGRLQDHTARKTSIAGIHMSKLTLCIDFDGVVHQYVTPWAGIDVIPDDVVPGFFEWADAAAEHFHLVIYSARSKDEKGRTAMALWLIEQRKKWIARGGVSGATWQVSFDFAIEKPKAFLYIDDRAHCFDGDWSKLSPAAIRDFKPWNEAQKLKNRS